MEIVQPKKTGSDRGPKQGWQGTPNGSEMLQAAGRIAAAGDVHVK